MTTFAPKIDPTAIRNLRLICRLYQEDPEYFSKTDYSADVRELVRDLAGKAGGSDEKQDGKLPPRHYDSDAPIDLLTELKETYIDLKRSMPDRGEASAMQSFFRNKVTLLERLSDMMARADDQKSLNAFYSQVLDILETVCTPEQRQKFQTQLQEFAQK